jgi:hypothetical protein
MSDTDNKSSTVEEAVSIQLAIEIAWNHLERKFL